MQSRKKTAHSPLSVSAPVAAGSPASPAAPAASVSRVAPAAFVSHAALAALVVVAGAGAGCDGCPGSKPYTPYTMTDAPAGATGGAIVDGASGGGGAPPSGNAMEDAGEAGPAAPPSFTPIQAERAPGDGKTWTVEPDIAAKAPAGRAFSLGLLVDADGDGKRDLVAWAAAPDGLRGELRIAPGGKPDQERTIAALPGDLSAQGCTARTSLAVVGPGSIAFDFAPQCAPGRKAIRWVAVIRFGKAEAGAVASGPALGLEIRAGLPPAGEALDIAVDGSDRDGDGRDDIAAKITLSGGIKPFTGAVGPYPNIPPASAVVAFFDRSTGLSRDPSEPGASLAAAAIALGADAKRKDTAGRVAPAAHELRRLRSMLCDEGGKALVTTSAGPILCDGTRDAEEVGIAEATAAVTKSDPARALAAIGRIDARAPLGDARKREIIKILGKTSPIAGYQLAYRTTASPKTAAVGWSPLAFEPSGDLLVETEGGVVRVDRASFAESPAGVDAWPLAFTSAGSGASGDAWVLAAVEQRCDSPVLAALVEDANATGDPAERRTSIGLPLLTPVNAKGMASGGRCSAIGEIPITPIASSAELGLVFSLGGDLVGLKRQNGAAVVSLVASPLDPTAAGAVVKGAARSPDGATIAVPTSRGLLVSTSGGASRLWSGPEMEQGSRCVPAAGGVRVACVTGSAAAIYDAR